MRTSHTTVDWPPQTQNAGSQTQAAVVTAVRIGAIVSRKLAAAINFRRQNSLPGRGERE